MTNQVKVALVTGAASGIGRATAELYARNDYDVVLADIDEAAGAHAAAAIVHSGGNATFVHADVSRPEECRRLVSEALESFGRLDACCNNAGIAGELNPTADYGLEAWSRVIAVNLSSVFYCMKFEIPALMRSGGGAIVNVSSILGQVAFAGAPAYTAAKHGVVGLTRCTAIEYGARGIRINAVGPGFISTPMIRTMEEDPTTNQALISMHPIGRLGRSDEVAELIVWLSSDKASFVTGSYYAIDGGYLAR